METVGDVIEFWVNWCAKQNVAEHYGESVIDAGRLAIVEDAEYWGNQSMWKLLDTVKA